MPTYRITDDGCLMEYDCQKEAHVTLPEGIKRIGPKGYVARGLFQNVWNGNNKVESVVIPEGVEAIAMNTFRDCKCLKSVSLPSTLKVIGENAFWGCEALEEIVLPEGLTTLAHSVFGACQNLKKIHLPASLQTLGFSAFTHCTSLAEVTGLRPALLKENSIFFNCNALADEQGFIILGHILYGYLGTAGEVTIPDTVERISDGLSSNDTLVSVHIPDSVKELPAGLLGYCKNLTSVRLPAGIREIPNGFFRYCTSLTRFEIPDGITAVNDDMFNGCSALEEVVLPETVTKIGTRAFSGCTALRRINLPGKLKNIGPEAFSGCSALEDVDIPDSVRELCGFDNCEKLNPVKIPAKLKKIGTFSGCPKITTLMLPAGVEVIGWNGFGKKMLIHSAELFATPWEPRTKAPKLWDQAPVIFPIGADGKIEYKILLCHAFEKLKTFDKKGNLNWKTYDALLCGKDLKLTAPYATLAMLYRLRWPQELEEDRKQLFITQITKDLKKVAPFVNLCPEDGLIAVLEENGILTEKNKKTILPLMGIGEAPAPKKAAKKAEAAPDGVKTPAQLKKEWGTKKLDDGTLWLTSYKGTDTVVEVPAAIGKDAVTVVGKECFSCSTWGRATKEQVAARKKITEVIIPEGITRIEEDAFRDCVGLERVQLPSTLKVISLNAFQSCKNLKQINLPEGVELGSSAFWGCAGLKDENGFVILGGVLFNVYRNAEELVIPASVKRISPYAIKSLPDLKSVVFPDGITRLPGQTITYCENVTEMTIPASVSDIHYSAFSVRNKVTVHGWTGSTAEVFCKNQYGWTFDSIGVLEQEESDFVIQNGVLLEYKGSDEKVVIPEGVKVIGSRTSGWSAQGAFAGNKTLRHLVIPEGVELIENAFYDCENLETIEFPVSVIDVANRAFFYTKWYKNLPAGPVYAGSALIAYVAYPDASQEPETLVIPEGIRTICSSAMFGVLKNTKKIVLPSTLEVIRSSAFSHSVCLEEMVVPAALREIEDYAFDFVNLKRCSGGVLHRTEKLPAKFKVFYTGDPADTAWVTLYQGEQSWRKAVREKIDSNPEIVAPAMAEMARLIMAMDPLDKTAGNRAAAFAQELCKAAMGEPVKALYEALKAKNFAGLKKLEANAEFMACLEGGVQEDLSKLHPVEAKVVEALMPTPAFEKVLQRIIETVPYAGTEEQCAPRVLAFVVYEYVRQYDPDNAKYISEYEHACTPYEKSPIADQVAAALDQNKLIDALRQLAERYEGEYYLPYARYADDKTAVSILSQMNKWDNWGYFGATGRKNIIIARSGLLLNDTRAAMIHMDKVGQLGTYAKMRGTDADTLRDTVLADFGFDENRQIRYDLGGNTVVIAMDTELNLTIFDTNADKIVKSIPKKNADTALYEKAKAAFSELKKNIKKVITNRKHRLFADFLSGAKKDAGSWKQAYLGNPVLNSVARLLVWQQGSSTFTLTLEGPVCSDGSAYEITDAPIGVAHPIEMRPEIAAWQTYFTEKGLKQPFEQVWEPAYNAEDIKPDRYEGSSLNVYRLSRKEEHGIRIWGLEAYSEEYGFELTDCKMEQSASEWRFVSGITDNATFTLGKFTFEKLTRYVNHIVYLFDKWTIPERVAKDDTSISDHLNGITLAQTTEWLDIAMENKAENVKAILLEYKNAHFPDLDPMAEFTLEW